MLGALFVKDGIGIVDVIVDFARARDFREALESAAGAGNRYMAHTASEFSAAASADQFVVGPECAVDQEGVALVPIGEPGFFEIGQRGRAENFPAGWRFNPKTDDCVAGRNVGG